MRRIFWNVADYERIQPSLPRPLVYINGCFDLCHPGQLFLLKRGRSLGRSLVVGLNGDESVQALKGPDRPIIPEKYRAQMLMSLECVDAVLVFQTPRCDREIRAVCPDVYLKGRGWSLDLMDVGERKALEDCGTRVVIDTWDLGHSTTNLIERLRK